MPARIKQLQNWLADQCGLTGFTLEPASGDASFRRYFRITLSTGDTLIAMDAPPEQEDCTPFIQVAELLHQSGVHVPELHQQDLQQGFLLLEDLGEKLYLDHLDQESVNRLYGDALSALMTMQATVSVEGLPHYDQKLLSTEMQLFPDWLLDTHLQLELNSDEQAMLQQTLAMLAATALEQPQVFVHRDYHSRNLLISKPPTPGVIDFQDAVAGPITYDLVSLLRDCYIEWPEHQVDAWAAGYHELCIQSGILSEEVSEQDFIRWFDLMGAQRHLKAAGIFARLNHRDGKPGYMADIPRTLGYIVSVAERRPELQPLAALIAERVLPQMVSSN